MRDGEDGMSGERQRQNGERVARVADQGRSGDDQEADGERHLEPDALMTLGGNSKADEGAGAERQEKRGELAQAQLRHESIRRRRWDEGGADCVPSKPDRQAARSHGDGPQSFSHVRQYIGSEKRARLRARDIDEIERVDAIRRRIERRHDGVRRCSVRRALPQVAFERSIVAHAVGGK